ncbi:MAG: hypothetical protein IT431_04925 [Phycisphaerales bacterium]|nr:hypothetical protein [Phycisphaerales bacterium]
METVLKKLWNEMRRPAPSLWPVPYLRRHHLPGAYALLALLVLGVVGSSLSGPALSGVNGAVVFVVSLAWWTPGLLVWFLSSRRRRRLRARAREADGCLCIHCAYPIAHTPDEGVCPECGRPFRLAESRAKWRSALRLDEW